MRSIAKAFVVVGSLSTLCGLASVSTSQEKMVEKSREVKKVRVVPYVEPPRAEPPGAKAAAAEGLAAAAPSRCRGGNCGAAKGKLKHAVSKLRWRKG